MNIREKEIISNLRSPEAATKNRQVFELFYGKGKDTEVLRKKVKDVIHFCFSGDKYHGKQDEIYDTLVSLICEDIWKASAETIEKIDNLSWYFFRLARNCANRNRSIIHVCIGIKDDTTLGAEHDKKQEEEEIIDDILTVFIDDNPNDGDKPREDVAAAIVNRYISKVPRKEYRDIIIAIDINDWSHEQITRKLGIRPKDIDQFHRRAKLALTTAALPDIKKHCVVFFHKYRYLLSQEDSERLDCFFSNSGISKGNDIASIYLSLVKAVNKERTEHTKEWRRAVREYKKRQKELETTNNR